MSFGSWSRSLNPENLEAHPAERHEGGCNACGYPNDTGPGKDIWAILLRPPGGTGGLGIRLCRKHRKEIGSL